MFCLFFLLELILPLDIFELNGIQEVELKVAGKGAGATPFLTYLTTFVTHPVDEFPYCSIAPRKMKICCSSVSSNDS